MERSDYEARTVPQLRKELEGRGLDTEGNKDPLIDRLVADDERRAALEAETVDQLKDDLRDAELPVSGTKDELVDRLAEAEPATEPERQREQRAIEAGGHTILVDVDPETPPEITTCSICGGDDCVHLQPDYGQTWATTEAPEAAPVVSDGTFWPDETVGPRSAETSEEE